MDVWSKYEATAARPRQPWSRDALTGTVTVDMHGHANAPAAIAFAAQHAPAAAPQSAATLADAVNALHAGDTGPLLDDPLRRREALDRMGIDVQLVWPTPHLHAFETLPADVAARAAELANDGMAEWVAADPSRYVAGGVVALHDGAVAAAELERAVSRLGLKGVQILGRVGSREISDPAFEPFWAKAEALGALVFVHGSGNNLGGRLRRHNLVNAIGNPLETTIALSFLISDGVLERFPRLKILAAHGGGYLGAYPGRSDHNWGARADGYNGLPHPPSFYLTRNVVFDSVVFTPHQLRHLLDAYGPERVVIGTDYPFNMGEFEPVEHVLSAGLDPAAQRAVLGDTARRLLSL